MDRSSPTLSRVATEPQEARGVALDRLAEVLGIRRDRCLGTVYRGGPATDARLRATCEDVIRGAGHVR